MSGNTIASATAAGAPGVTIRWAAVFAVVAFVVGVGLGIVIAEECARHTIRRVLTVTLLPEVALLGVFVAWAASGARTDAIVVPAALAMGMQTAALRRVAGQTTRTVYVTGMLTRWAEEAVRYAYWRRDRRRERASEWRNEPSVSRLVLLAGIVAAYAIGAVVAGWLDGKLHLWTFSIPIALLVALAIVDTALDLDPPAR